MYLEYINYQNVGAVHNLSIPFSFNQDGSPKPIIFVGENGSGKSILLSNIVDAFYEIANKAYINVSIHDGMSTKFYKVISPIQISPGRDYMAAYLRFSDSGQPIEYIFKGGVKNWETYNIEKFNDSQLNTALKWQKDEENHKQVTFQGQMIGDTQKEDIERIFSSNVICCFPPDRYEKPNWLADSYHTISESEHLGLGEKYQGKLYTPLTVSSPVNDNLKWLLDVIVDSRAEVIQTGAQLDEKGHAITFNGQPLFNYGFAQRFNQRNLSPLLNARSNVEQILTDILGKEVCFELNMRNVKTSGRFRVVEKNSGDVVIPTFDSLSTGQMALFNLFVTIIRYADYNDVNKSIILNDISGIVVIDEVELHLHSNLLREILPKLIKRFPKVQFIITSHSPLFILGMENSFGSSGYEMYQMPDGRKIDAEMFSEFQKAYEYLTYTQKYQSDITTRINNSICKPLVVTEGKTDWIHLKAAYAHLRTIEDHRTLFEGMDIEFLEFTDDMGDTQLCSLCKSTAKVKRNNAVIFIADADKPAVTKDLAAAIPSTLDTTEPVKPYRLHSKDACSKTYSFILPVPQHRELTPLVSIEHYYTDGQINREVECNDGIKRRLYMGKEFDSTGMGDGVRCGKKSINKCGDGRIDIIDDDVYEAKKDCTTNIALSKIEFAQHIAKRTAPFESVDFPSFLPIFEIIREILVAEGLITEQ